MRILTKGNYYGKKQAEYRFNGIVLSEYDYLTQRTDWHFHENPYFMYVLQGSVDDINKKEKRTCGRGSLIFHNWQESHYNSKKTEHARGFHVEFDRKWFSEKKIDIDLWEGSHLLHQPAIHHLLGKLYVEFKTQDVYSQVSIELLLLQICESIQNHQELAQKKTPPWLDRLKELLLESPEELHLDSLAEKLGVHPVHLSRSIPKYLSTTLGEYIRSNKIKQALGYMLNPDYSLTEIAYICGFSDQSHFTKTFKFYFHKTPKAFRSQMAIS